MQRTPVVCGSRTKNRGSRLPKLDSIHPSFLPSKNKTNETYHCKRSAASSRPVQSARPTVDTPTAVDSKKKRVTFRKGTYNPPSRNNPTCRLQRYLPNFRIKNQLPRYPPPPQQANTQQNPPTHTATSTTLHSSLSARPAVTTAARLSRWREKKKKDHAATRDGCRALLFATSEYSVPHFVTVVSHHIVAETLLVLLLYHSKHNTVLSNKIAVLRRVRRPNRHSTQHTPLPPSPLKRLKIFPPPDKNKLS